MNRTFQLTSAILLVVSPIAVAVGCSQGTVEDASKVVELPLGTTPSTQPSCEAACIAADTCGLLTSYGVDQNTCVQLCLASFTEEDAQWAQTAQCDELEAAINNGGAPDPCADACDKLDGCGVLAAAGLAIGECQTQCSGYPTGLVAWANDPATTCDDLASALGVTLSTPCEDACANADACGILAQYGLDAATCPSFCESSFEDAQAEYAATLSCSDLDAFIQSGGQVPSTPCRQLCEKADGCGLLAQYGIDVDACEPFCESSYSAAEVNAALQMTCSDLANQLP